MRIIPAAPPVAANLSIVAIVLRQFCDSSHFKKRNDFNNIDSMRQFSCAYIYGKRFAAVKLLLLFFHVYTRRKLSPTVELIDSNKENYRNKLSITIDNYRKLYSLLLVKPFDANGKHGQCWPSIAERWPGFSFEREGAANSFGLETRPLLLTSRMESGPYRLQAKRSERWTNPTDQFDGEALQ